MTPEAKLLLCPSKATARAKKVLEYAEDEARRMGHEYVGTEHILLGLIREGEGLGGQVLHHLRVDLEDVRNMTHMLLGTRVPVEPTPPSPEVVRAIDTALSALAEQITDAPEPINDVDADCRIAFKVLEHTYSSWTRK